MWPLFHPSAQDITVEGILHALSDPVRIHIFTQIARASCPQTCSTFLRITSGKLPKSTLSVHFKVLREAGLIQSERKGVELRSTSRCAELHDRFGKLITAIIEAHIAQTAREQSARKPRRKRTG